MPANNLLASNDVKSYEQVGVYIDMGVRGKYHPTNSCSERPSRFERYQRTPIFQSKNGSSIGSLLLFGWPQLGGKLASQAFRYCSLWWV
jgi:hypothetical protein